MINEAAFMIAKGC